MSSTLVPILEESDRYDPLIAQGLARVTGFEPNPAELERLAERPGPYRYLPLFLGDGEPATFHLTRYPGCSSLLEPDPAIINLFETMGCEADGNFHVVGTERVQTSRLDDLLPDVRGDYIKIDVQGAELTILRNGRAVLARTLFLRWRLSLFRSIAASPSSATCNACCATRVSHYTNLSMSLGVHSARCGPETCSPPSARLCGPMQYSCAIFRGWMLTRTRTWSPALPIL